MEAGPMNSEFVLSPSQRVRQVDVGGLALTNGRVSCTVWERDVSDGASVKYVQTPPGSGSVAGFHTHPWPQYLYVLRGELSVEIAGEAPITATSDVCVLVPPFISHRTVNLGPTTCCHLSIGK
jgi:quercetin dioxygenase-like cupin family protein